MSKTTKPKPLRDTKGRFMPRNRWHSPKAIAQEGFHLGLGDSPNDDPYESYCMNRLVSRYNARHTAEYNAAVKISLDWHNPPTTKIPDISIIDIHTLRPFRYSTLVVIELDNNEGEHASVKRCKEMVAEGVKEAFFYNVQKKQWRKFDAQGEQTARPSYSNLLRLDFAKLL